MKKYLNLSLALSLFFLGWAVGRMETLPQLGIAHADLGGADLSNVHAAGSSDGALRWEQEGSQLTLKVIGEDVAFLGSAVLNDPWAWPELGSGESQILEGGQSFSLDLEPVEEMTIYRLEPVGRVIEEVFRPCAEYPAGCFPVRPPIPPPPGPEHHHVYATSP